LRNPVDLLASASPEQYAGSLRLLLGDPGVNGVLVILPPPPPKGIFPVVGVTPGLTGCLQAMEVLKFLTGLGTNLKGRLLTFDGEDMTFASFRIYRMKSCPDCGHLV